VTNDKWLDTVIHHMTIITLTQACSHSNAHFQWLLTYTHKIASQYCDVTNTCANNLSISDAFLSLAVVLCLKLQLYANEIIKAQVVNCDWTDSPQLQRLLLLHYSDLKQYILTPISNSVWHSSVFHSSVLHSHHNYLLRNQKSMWRHASMLNSYTDA